MKWRKKAFRSSKWWIGLVGILLLLGVFLTDRALLPLLQQYSRSQAEWQATRIINEAVTAVLAAEQPTYENLVSITKDADGAVISAEADMRRLNLLKAAVTNAVAENIGKEQEIIVSVPIGTLLGNNYFSGRGPCLHIPVSMSGSVLTTLISSFDAAGVNQTAHRIKMQIKAKMFIAVPTAYATVEVDTIFIIAESILLGKVPSAYTVVTGDDQDTTGEIFDYRAENQN